MTDKLMMTTKHKNALLALIATFLPHTEVWAFGSRVQGSARPSSDLDLVAFLQPQDRSKVASLIEALEESNLPFRVDLLVWDAIPEHFQTNIQSHYIVLVPADTPSTSASLEGGKQKGIDIL